MHDLFALLRALESHQRNQALAAGLDAIVATYYEEYSDATELDRHTRDALELLFDLCFPGGELDDGRDFEALVARK